MIRRFFGFCQVAAVAVLVGAGSVQADTLSLSAAKDTFINSSSPDNNGGGMLWFDAGTDGGRFGPPGVRRGLIKFDLATVPPGSTITSAVLRLKATKIPPDGVDSTFDLFRVTADWGEGNNADSQNGGPAVAGDANWNSRVLGTANWSQPGGLGEIAAAASASTPVNGTAGPFSWSGSAMLEDVRFWFTNSSQNFGWMLRSQAEETPRSVRGFGSSEDPANAPVLEIGYSTASTENIPPTVTIITPTNGASFTAPATVTITAEANDSDGTIARVQFFSGTNLLGSDETSPYEISAPLFPGNHVLSAVATDNAQATGSSAVVTVSVGNTTISDPIAERIPKGALSIELETVADGMASPLGMAAPDDGSGRIFVYDQDGRIYIVAGGVRQRDLLLDLRSSLVLLGAYDERGLLGMAVHPNFAQNPLIYTYTSEPVGAPADFQTGIANNHQSVISEWRISLANSNQVDMTSRREILRIDQPQSNHNGGAMHFGPDGMLYITLGDGGQANDVAPGHVPGGNAQDLNRIWGKLIRIDVHGNNSANGKYGVPPQNPFIGTNALPEVYAYGLRNPFAFSFDRDNGQIYLADVGQGKVEEVNIVTAGGNYGWNLREARFWFDSATGSLVQAPVRPPPAGMIDPIAQYDHDDGTATIGGYVYRGGAIPGLAGTYVFGDWGTFGAPSGRLFYLDETNGVKEFRIGHQDRPLGIWLKGFGQGADGELYVFGSRWLGPSGNTGRMLKIVPVADQVALGSTTLAGTNLAIEWSGGKGPFAVQRKQSLTDRTWSSASVVNARTSIVNRTLSSGFFRVGDAASLPPVPFTAYLSGGAERPANNSAGTGFGIFILDGNTLTFNLSYKGLSGPARNGHIHGPASASSSTNVLIDLAPYNAGTWGSTGTLSGVLVLTATQKAHLLAGLTYVNLHTDAFPGGEIRGHIAPVNFQVELDGKQENPVIPTSARGLGGLSLVGNQLTFNITYGGLTTPATMAHIHGPALPGQNATVMVDLGGFKVGAFSTNGALSGTVTLTPGQLASVIDGMTYVNIHNSTFTGGEIRGQIVPHPTGVPSTVLLSGLAEKPTPLVNTATGNGTLSLDGNALTFNISYSGLSGNAIGAHIHGITNTAGSAPVLVNLAPFNGGTFSTNGTLSGTVLLNNTQRDALLAGKTYINIHTQTNPDGEMRGQIAPVGMTASLSGNNERNTPVQTAGSGSGTFALVRDQLAVAVIYQNLSTNATMSHIHGPAGFLQNASVLVDLQSINADGFGVSGALSGTVQLTVPQLLSVIDGQTYVNFHTSVNTGGEVRGQILR